MNNANNTPFGGLDHNTFRKLQMEYLRTNPHNLPELHKRPRIRKKGTAEKVFSTRAA